MKILTIDIGGTAIKSSLFENGKMIQKNEVDSNAHLGVE